MEAFDLKDAVILLSLSCAQSAYNYVFYYIQERKQFGKAIIDFQAVQIQLAEIKMKLDASRLLYRAVVNADKELPSIAESSIAKCFANEIAREVTEMCSINGRIYGYSKEFPIEQKMRRCMGLGNSRRIN